jgi:phosphotransferase family enzyme
MSHKRRSEPLAIISTDLAEHPVVRVWSSLGGPVPTRVELLRRAKSKPAIYRMVFEDTSHPAVFVKHSQRTGLELERRMYQDVLPRLPLTVPRYLGSCLDDEGLTWLFIEDVGAGEFLAGDPGHRVLAARWLGLMHGSAATRVAGVPFPDAGPARYLGHLHRGRERIRTNLGNPAMDDQDRAILNGMLERLDEVEARWPGVERACQGLPVTLVHGDMRKKNVRIGRGTGAPVLYGFDWEMAGWGVPAADLASACGRGATIRLDPETYVETVREFWPDFDAAAVSRLSVLGRIFQALAGAEWDGASLRFESTVCLLMPVSSMRIHDTTISGALAAGAGWLR